MAEWGSVLEMTLISLHQSLHFAALHITPNIYIYKLHITPNIYIYKLHIPPNNRKLIHKQKNNSDPNLSSSIYQVYIYLFLQNRLTSQSPYLANDSSMIYPFNFMQRLQQMFGKLHKKVQGESFLVCSQKAQPELRLDCPPGSRVNYTTFSLASHSYPLLFTINLSTFSNWCLLGS